MLAQHTLSWWDIFQQSASSGEEGMSGLLENGCTTPLAVYDYNEAFNPLHMHELKTEEVRVIHKS